MTLYEFAVPVAAIAVAIIGAIILHIAGKRL